MRCARSATILIALGIALAGGAYAADEDAEMEAPSFEEVDANDNGVISEAEAAEVPQLDFASADKNGDGVLSRTEYEAAMAMS